MSSDVIIVERDLLKAEAFRSLSGTAKTVLFDFMMKRKIKGVKVHGRKVPMILNNGEIVYPYAEAEKKGIPRTSFMRCLTELVSKGFIDIAWSGSGGKKGDVSLYAISDRWADFGTDKFKSATRPKDTRQGRGFRRGNSEWKKARRSNIGARNGNSTIAENGNPKADGSPLNCQKRQSNIHEKGPKSLASIGWSPVFPV
jgi:hypothetical protein